MAPQARTRHDRLTEYVDDRCTHESRQLKERKQKRNRQSRVVGWVGG